MQQSIEPEAVFDLLSDRSRMQILDALYTAWFADPESPCLAFSELYSEVEVSDSGQFTYHLNRLCGILLEKRDAGYALTPLGIEWGMLLNKHSTSVNPASR